MDPQGTDKLYAFDTPELAFFVANGKPKHGGHQRLVQRMNGAEFVRVRVDGGTFDYDAKYGNPPYPMGPVQGSRASELNYWQSWIDSIWDTNASKWVRRENQPDKEYNSMRLIRPQEPVRDLNTPPRG